MEERQLGRTGARVSSIGLGTLTWARDTDAETAAELLAEFAAAGGTLLDTAASYADGAAEELIGSLLGVVVPREDLVLCTKGGLRRTPRGPVVDSSRRALLSSIDGSLRRLGTDHVDLFLVQQPDGRTPSHEVATTLQHIVQTGRARYAGLSNHAGWRCARIGTLMGAEGLAAVEVEYSLVQREAEQEVVPAAAEVGAGILAWSPLGRGVLTGKYRRTVPADSVALVLGLGAVHDVVVEIVLVHVVEVVVAVLVVLAVLVRQVERQRLGVDLHQGVVVDLEGVGKDVVGVVDTRVRLTAP